MAFPTIKYASGGSDTQASGAGPSTAITGTNAAHTNGVSSEIITFTDGPDLSGVATDGSAALWLNTASGRKLFRIIAVDDGADTVDVDPQGTTISAASAVDYAIGGTRQTLQGDSGQPDWDDWDWNWTVELDAGTYTCTSRFDPGGFGVTAYTDGPLRIVAKDGAASRPVITQSGNNNHPYLLAGEFYFEGIKFTVSNNGSSTYANILSSNGVVFRDCIFTFDNAGNLSNYLVFCSGRGPSVFVDCFFQGIGSNREWAIYEAADDSNLTVIGCVFDGISTDFTTACIEVRGDEGSATIQENLFYDGGGDAIRLYLDFYKTYNILNNTITDCASDGVHFTGITNNQVTCNGLIMNNLFTYNTGYGINEDGTGPNASRLLIDYNFYYSNTAGEVFGSNISKGSNGVTLSADPYEDRASDDYRLNDTAGGGTAVQGAAFPDTFPDGT